MTKKGRKKNHDLRLKIAIIQSRRTQRDIAQRARIGEVRLSKLVRRVDTPATDDEMNALAKVLGRPVEDLFDVRPAPAPAAPADLDTKSA